MSKCDLEGLGRKGDKRLTSKNMWLQAQIESSDAFFVKNKNLHA